MKTFASIHRFPLDVPFFSSSLPVSRTGEGFAGAGGMNDGIHGRGEVIGHVTSEEKTPIFI